MSTSRLVKVGCALAVNCSLIATTGVAAGKHTPSAKKNWSEDPRATQTEVNKLSSQAITNLSDKWQPALSLAGAAILEAPASLICLSYLPTFRSFVESRIGSAMAAPLPDNRQW